MVRKLLVDVDEAGEIIGCGRSKIYELSGLGLLDARKLDGKTVITLESIERYAAALPKAQIRPYGRRAKQAAQSAQAA